MAFKRTASPSIMTMTVILTVAGLGGGTAHYGFQQYRTAAASATKNDDQPASPYRISSMAEPAVVQKTLGNKPTFPSWRGVTLTLEDSHMVNHNVKMLRFKLPEGDAISGLSPICMS